jgi:hypothetical protein
MSHNYHSNGKDEITNDPNITEGKMKITHTTHEANKRGRSTSLTSSTAQKLKNYFSDRIHGRTRPKEEDEEALVQPDPKARERKASDANVPRQGSFSTNENQELRRSQSEKRSVAASKVRAEEETESWVKYPGSYWVGKKSGSLRWNGYGRWPAEGPPINETRQFSPPPPPLSRKACFENLRTAERTADGKYKTQGDYYMNRLRAQRVAISEGKLEKVLPPPKQRSKLTLQSEEPRAEKMTHKKSSSTVSKLGSYMGTSADILDATRRDMTSNLTSNLRKNVEKISGRFDHLGHYAFGLMEDAEESDSDDTLYCIGESRESQETWDRRFVELEKARRMSGDGTDPWIDGQQKECRICHKRSPAGIRGLCKFCEKDYRRINAVAFGDIKPPAPLKIYKVSRPSENAQVASGSISNPFSDEIVNRPKINNTVRRPQFVTPESHHSQEIEIDDGSRTAEARSDKISSFERWQSPEVRALYKSKANERTRWSESLLDDDKASAPAKGYQSKFTEVGLQMGDEDGPKHLPVKDNGESKKTRKTKGPQRYTKSFVTWDDIMEVDEDGEFRFRPRDDRDRKI